MSETIVTKISKTELADLFTNIRQIYNGFDFTKPFVGDRNIRFNLNGRIFKLSISFEEHNYLQVVIRERT